MCHELTLLNDCRRGPTVLQMSQKVAKSMDNITQELQSTFFLLIASRVNWKPPECPLTSDKAEKAAQNKPTKKLLVVTHMCTVSVLICVVCIDVVRMLMKSVYNLCNLCIQCTFYKIWSQMCHDKKPTIIKYGNT